MKPFLTLAVYAVAVCISPAAASAAPRDEPLSGSAYGLFLAGSTALDDGRSRDAARYFDAAAKVGDVPDLMRDQQFMAALLAGEVSKAASLAPLAAHGDTAAYRLGRLTVAVEAIAKGRGKAARSALALGVIGYPHRGSAALLTPWAAAVDGDSAASIARPDPKGDRLIEVFGQLGQAQLFERARRYDEAETDFKALANFGQATGLFALEYGCFLERRGRRADAIALYDAALAESPNDRELKAARLRAAARRPPPAQPSLAAGAANALLAPAAALAGDKQNQLALIYLHLALRLDPDRADAWLLLGDVLQSAEDWAGAREAYGQVGDNSPRYADAQAKVAWTFQVQGDKETAVRLAGAASKAAPSDLEIAAVYADVLRANDRHAEAVGVLDRVIAGEPDPDWRTLYGRAVSLERLNRWPEAERDLQSALAKAPDQPDLLNFLGYSWIDRGLHVEEGFVMVQKALSANPKSGAVTDSLGWAYYRKGDYRSAVGTLERAVELDAGEPEINDHLGDAYWRVGRLDEARFQWRRVLTLEPDETLKTAAETKLKDGLPPVAPPPAKSV